MNDLPPIQINLADPAGEYAMLSDGIDAAVGQVLSSGRYILGPQVTSLESEVAGYLGVGHCVGVSSGTDAIQCALHALGVGPGDRVVTTAWSFFATASAIMRVGARPVFVDIEKGGFNLDPELVAPLLDKKTKAIVVVHLFGHPADMEWFESIASDRGIPLVEDAAQAFGAIDGTRKAGTIGVAGCFSFFPAKPLGACGDAGLVCTDDADLAVSLRSVRVQGASGKNLHARAGSNYRLDPIQAAILRVKLPLFDEWTATRRRYAELYNQRLASLEKSGSLVLPRVRSGVTSTWAQFVVRTPRRDALQKALRAEGIASEVYYPMPMPAQEAMGEARVPPETFPESAKASAEVLALPVHPLLDPSDIETVSRIILEFFDSGRGGDR